MLQTSKLNGLREIRQRIIKIALLAMQFSFAALIKAQQAATEDSQAWRHTLSKTQQSLQVSCLPKSVK